MSKLGMGKLVLDKIQAEVRRAGGVRLPSLEEAQSTTLRRFASVLAQAQSTQGAAVLAAGV